MCRSVYGYALAGLAVLALGISWSLGAVGCGPVPSSSYTDATPGAFYPKVRQSPVEVARLLQNAHYYKLMGRPELALKELEQAHQQNPDNLQLVNTLAQSYEELGQFDAARKIYQEALTLNGPHPALANNLCFTYYLEGRYQEAETCYRQTLARDPGNEAARNNLGLLYCRLGRTDEARRLWQEMDGTAAADYKTRQALAALGMADRAVYAQRTAPASVEVAAVASHVPAAPLAPQKLAMQLPAQPAPEQAVPDNDQPDNVVQEQAAPLITSPATASHAALKSPDRAVVAPTSHPAPPVQAASPPTSIAAVSLPPASRASELGTPAAPLAPQKVAMPVAPQPVPELVKPGHEAQPKPAPGQAAPAPATPPARPAYLTCTELVDTNIEVRNGTPTPHLAREVRYLLSQEAFTVVKIGNHVDFGAEKTMIYYRPVAKRVAQALQTDIFPMAALEQSDQLGGKAAIKVLLGHDLLDNQDLMARLGKDKAQPMTAEATPPPADQRLAAPAAAERLTPSNQNALPQERTAPSQPPAPVAQTPRPHSFEPLTALELEYTAIEVLNGTRTPHLARRTRTLLDLEGFSVARIGNYINFGAEKTIIYYRPEAQRVARTLGETLFPGAGLEPNAKLRKDIAVKILLGADLLERPQLMARLATEAQ
ncbi:MAG: LytR C-terminal domain-containing protein [Desulfobaccales bacterium]